MRRSLTVSAFQGGALERESLTALPGGATVKNTRYSESGRNLLTQCEEFGKAVACSGLTDTSVRK